MNSYPSNDYYYFSKDDWPSHGGVTTTPDIKSSLHLPDTFGDGLNDFTFFDPSPELVHYRVGQQDQAATYTWTNQGESFWQGEDEPHALEPWASTHPTTPPIAETSSDSGGTSSWAPLDEEIYAGTTVDPQDICDLAATSTPPSIDHTVDERKPLDDYKSFPSAPMRPGSSDLEPDLYSSDPYFKTKGNAGCYPVSSTSHSDRKPSPTTANNSGITTYLDPRASYHPISFILGPHRGGISAHDGIHVRGDDLSESLYTDVNAEGDPDYHPSDDESTIDPVTARTSSPIARADPSVSGNPYAPSPSSSAVGTTRGIKRCRDEDYSEGDREVTKRPKRNTRPRTKTRPGKAARSRKAAGPRTACPYSDCTSSFSKAIDCRRHIRQKHFKIRSACRIPHCVFDGARLDVVQRHEREAEHGSDELGCTCGANNCIDAREFKLSKRE